MENFNYFFILLKLYIQINLDVDIYALIPSRPSVFVNQEFHGSVQEYISHEFMGETHLLAIVEVAKPKEAKRNSQYFKDPTLDSYVMSSIRTQKFDIVDVSAIDRAIAFFFVKNGEYVVLDIESHVNREFPDGSDDDDDDDLK